jgi:hypothetical protein
MHAASCRIRPRYILTNVIPSDCTCDVVGRIGFVRAWVAVCVVVDGVVDGVVVVDVHRANQRVCGEQNHRRQKWLHIDRVGGE